ncbi:MAG: bifunctional 3-demethylubiquinol 3-O-methyltransferase/2-polyprenyl-6-hydroxyphenol methylase, partial [Gammaproteobacteria bacterium]
QALKPKGKLFLSTINRNLWSFLFAIVGAEYIVKLLPQGTHQYKDFIKPSELELWLRGAGGFIRNIQGISYNPLTKKAKLGHDIKINYILCAEKSEDF